MKLKIAGLFLLLSVIAVAAALPPIQYTPLTTNLIPKLLYAGGSVSNINVALTNVGSGGVVRVYSGDYYISNNTPVRVLEGRTLEGIGQPRFHVDTNGNNAGRLDLSTFQAFDNSKINGILWEATNGWNTTGDQAPYASFLVSGRSFTNVLVENCVIQGGSDVFYQTNSTYSHLTVKGCKISSFWDLFSTGNGDFVSIGNIWIGYGDATRPTRINNGGMALNDFGSEFCGFAGLDTSHGINGPFVPHGTRFSLTTPSENFIVGSAATLGGDYYDVVTGKTFSIGPEQAQWYTNAFTTNIAYSFNLTNVYVTAGNPDANVNGTYVLGTTDGNFSTGLSFWTNQSHATYVLRLNDPADTALEGGPPTAGIYSGNTSKSLGAPFTITGMATAGANIFSLGDGDTSCTAAFQTNSITTNRVNVLVPSVFNLAVVFATNNIFAGSGKRWAGDGGGLTNVPAASVSATLIQTNFIGGFVYSNSYGVAIGVAATVALTEAAVTGYSKMDLRISGTTTNTVGYPTSVSVVTGSPTNILSGYVPAGSTYTFTNTSTGAGNSSTISGGQLIVY